MGFSLSSLIILAVFMKIITGQAEEERSSEPYRPADMCNPLVIAHRGASGYVPEHTLGSYALAITLGADYVEPDLVMTKDGQMVARHDNELSLTTDISEHSEFAHLKRTQTIDGTQLTGWFTEDFTLSQLKTLRAVERIPNIRPGNKRLDRAFVIPTFQEIIDLVLTMQVSQRRTIGVYPEIKHSTHFKNLGLPIEGQLIQTLHRNGFRGPRAPVYIQSFEISNLKSLRNITELRLLQLFDEKSKQPYDQVVIGSNVTYEAMSTAEGLREVAKYANAVGPDKSYIIPRDSEGKLGVPTSFVHDAHDVGLKVHPYTFRAENTFLPVEFRSKDGEESSIGDLGGEIRAYLAVGIDGLFCDQPDVPVRVRGVCV